MQEGRKGSLLHSCIPQRLSLRFKFVFKDGDKGYAVAYAAGGTVKKEKELSKEKLAKVEAESAPKK